MVRLIEEAITHTYYLDGEASRKKCLNDGSKMKIQKISDEINDTIGRFLISSVGSVRCTDTQVGQQVFSRPLRGKKF